jgi:transposase
MMAEVTHKRFKTPYKSRVAKPTKARKAEIQAQLERGGQREPIFVDDEGNVLDGHTRYSILGDAVTFEVVNGFRSEAEKLAFVDKHDGGDRKNLTADQEKVRQKRMKENAKVLLSEGRTQTEVAELVGVCQKTISNWCGTASKVTNDNGRVTPPRQPRGLSPEVLEKIRAGITAGDSTAAVADRLGINKATVCKYVKKLGIERPKHKLGPVPTTISGKALHCRKLIENGKSRAAAAEECGFSSVPKYSRAVAVAVDGSKELRRAMDAEVLTVNAAHSLVDAKSHQIEEAIAAAREVKAAKERKAATADGKQQDKPKILLRLLARTIDDWGGFQKNTLAKGGWVPKKGENADKIRHQVIVAAQIIKEVVGVIQSKQGDADVNG